MVGIYLVPEANNGDTTDFDSIVFDVEKNVLRGDGRYDYGLLGDKEYIKLIADLDVDGEPQSQKYIDLVNGVNYVNNNGDTVIFSGIKQMLKGFIYNEISNNYRFMLSDSGQKLRETESAKEIKAEDYLKVAAFRYNKAIDIYNNEAYDYLLFYQSLFPDWDFTRKCKFFTNGLAY